MDTYKNQTIKKAAEVSGLKPFNLHQMEAWVGIEPAYAALQAAT
jgi:hypothetical protein